MVLVQLAILLVCIFIGARMSGYRLGRDGHDRPADPAVGLRYAALHPPLEVMLIDSQRRDGGRGPAGGGRHGLPGRDRRRAAPQLAGKITILGPLVTFCFTLFAGTSHISYSILPIIAEVAIKNASGRSARSA